MKPELSLKTGLLPEKVEYLLYDTMSISRNVSVKTEFFAIPKGQEAYLVNVEGNLVRTIKNSSYTNMPISNIFPSKVFSWNTIQLHLDNINASSFLETILAEYANLTMKIIDRNVFDIPLALFTRKFKTSTSNFVCEYTRQTDILINPFENFSVTLKFNENLYIEKPVNLRVVLIGTVIRPRM